jgi:LPPG:FO 2-phospho-L-lactate transferase
MRITLIAGAFGRTFVHRLAAELNDDDTLTVVSPTVRGHVSAGLAASPDLDALLSPPGQVETFQTYDALQNLGYSPDWQRASDQAVAARLIRTELTATGATLTDATRAAAAAYRLPFDLVPMSDQRAEFRVVLGTDSPTAVHVEDYLANPDQGQATQLLLVTENMQASPAALEALSQADVLVVAPESRTLVVDPVLRTPGIGEAIGADLPVLVADATDLAPADLVAAAGALEPIPGRTHAVAADARAVLELARSLVASGGADA